MASRYNWRETVEESRSRQQLKAVREIRELVLSGHFESGKRISELAVVELLEISRTPVRLALGQLEYEGLVERLPRGGFMVSDFSVSDIFDAIDIRGTLEGTAVRMATERLESADELATLKAINGEIGAILDRSGRSPEAFEQYAELNRQFHDELLRLAKCPLLERSLSQIEALPFASANAFVRVSGSDEKRNDVLFHAHHQHQLIIEAIEARQGGRACALAWEHAQLAAGNLRSAMRKEALFSEIPGAQLVRRVAGDCE